EQLHQQQNGYGGPDHRADNRAQARRRGLLLAIRIGHVVTVSHQSAAPSGSVSDEMSASMEKSYWPQRPDFALKRAKSIRSKARVLMRSPTAARLSRVIADVLTST